ncbi:(Fe-S)-binding protein, partial [Streptomyces sp. CHB9.2]|nr:(Fe-S)-binding protein [Streptomyces sp. CHB9.2]
GQAGIDVLAPAPRGALNWLKALPQRWRNGRQAEADFSHEVYDAMAGCLACKSCAGQCPIKVNVPEFRSRFLELYHRRYLRPVRDYLIGSLEFSLPLFARAPGLYNAVMGATPIQQLFAERIGMVDSPLLSRFDL